MNKKTLITAGVVAGGLAILYYLTMSKTAYAKAIAKRTGVDYRQYKSMDKGYLKARSSALKSGSPTFSYSGRTFNTQTGKAQ